MSTNANSAIAVSDTIVVKVGVEEKKYTLHKKLLLHHSSYFRGALSGNFKETDEGVIPLDDVQTDVFDIFVDYIYEKRLPESFYTSRSSPGEISIRLHAYILADRLMVPELRAAVFNHFFDIYGNKNQFPPYTALTFAFKSLPEGDPLVDLLIDASCNNNALDRYSKTGNFNTHIQDLPQEVFIRLFSKMRAIKDLSDNEKGLRREAYEV
jgi:hypothetical protein